MTNIFVFGSNLAGRHGKGAALFAKTHYGAEYGVGIGRTGRAYALPTKDENLVSLPLDIIGRYILAFILHARKHADDTFLLTPVGSGLAGHSRREILELFKQHELPANVVFTKEWLGW